MTPQPSPTNLSDELREKVDGILNSYWVDMLVAPSEKKQIVRDKAIAAITTAYAEAINEIIGEDEDPDNGRQQPGIYYRNNFRAEQRQRLQRLLPTNVSDEGNAR